ncbi:UNVERIFIED_CONTAM: putative E3 ubiquitin-protein ligase UBR7 [Sesamum latifolium]|uniref:E3 ubiquitin-protein ligase UBR7 n=1 Tax=Sesamum latifolium TaxID=2727402 RepID=A0AAW2SMM3_9LAMI
MADAFEDEVEGEPTISIKDYLEAVEEEELEADLVLGGDEGKECTYGKGYMKRQAIFSCLTCTPDGNAGVCTACCLSCHDGHEIVELWTKRNFRCDCGNSKFGGSFCKLLASKDVENANNVYNHNFKGTYCTCDLPYPDPNAEEQVEMIQCCICEDWFHEEHIGLQSTDKNIVGYAILYRTSGLKNS